VCAAQRRYAYHALVREASASHPISPSKGQRRSPLTCLFAANVPLCRSGAFCIRPSSRSVPHSFRYIHASVQYCGLNSFWADEGHNLVPKALKDDDW
jgi:hypothetical protein